MPAATANKIMLVGDGGVGKTAFIRRYITGNFEKKYEPTDETEVVPVHFETSKGHIIFDVLDTSGIQPNDYFKEVQAAIIMFSLTSRISYNNVPIWYSLIRDVFPDIPVVLCGNKADVVDHHNFVINEIFDYYEISSKTGYNLDKPFSYILRQLYGRDITVNS